MKTKNSKCDAIRKSKILEGTKLGLTQAQSASLGGITRDTLRLWRMRDAAFREAMEQAEAEGVKHLLEKIHAATVDTWQAAAWLLERRFPRQFGKGIEREDEMKDAQAEAEEQKQLGLKAFREIVGIPATITEEEIHVHARELMRSILLTKQREALGI